MIEAYTDEPWVKLSCSQSESISKSTVNAPNTLAAKLQQCVLDVGVLTSVLRRLCAETLQASSL